MTILFNDFETFSRVDLKKCGMHHYSRDPSTRALMLAYAFDNEKVQQWVPAEGQKMPRDLRDAMRDPDVIKSGWNSAFEICIWKNTLDEEVFFDEWRCSMVHAFTLSFPGNLAAAGECVNIDPDQAKDAEGKKLIRLFCQPKTRPKRIAKDPNKRKPFIERASQYTHPEEWEQFKEYNRQDVVAERAIYNRIKKWDLPDDEWAMWALDQEINHDGIPVNMAVVERAMDFVEYIREKRYRRIREITGVENPRSGPQMLQWLTDNGYRFDDLKKGHVQRAAEDTKISRDLKDVLDMRLEVSKTSTDKFYAMDRAVDDDDVIRGCLQFAGAQRTWRWSGRLIQPQNLARPSPELEDQQAQCVKHLETLSPKALELLYPKPMDLLSTCIRTSIQAPDGELIFSADLNAIENRVLGYLAQDQKILDVFRLGRDPYIDFAAYMYGTDYDTEYARFKPKEGKGNKDHRTISKPGVLGCGYMLSAGEQHTNRKTGEIEGTGLLGYAWNMGVKQFTLEDAKLSVRVWRETFADAVKFWWAIDEAARDCLRSGERTYAGPVEFDRSGPFMRMRLPSGRYLHYCRPRLEQVELVWCDEKRKFLPFYMCKRPDKSRTRIKEAITYEGLDDRNKWVRISTHPGKLTENADQAISRDLLKVAMQRFRRRVPRSEGRIRIHVHDEIVGMGPERYADRNYKILLECMSEPMPWASEKELPLGAAGSISKVWIKD